jgi:hypothetical protein
MEKLKKAVLYIAGPGVILVEAVALFIHLFTANDAKPWIIGGLAVFFVVFIPFYSIEYFRQNFRDNKDKRSMHFKKRKTRIEWEGGNIHGKIPKEVERPGKLFNK